MTDHLDLAPVQRLAGTVVLPGSKSISNRVLLLAALADGETVLEGVLDSDDAEVMRGALRALGVGLQQLAPRTWKVAGQDAFPGRDAEIFVGNSGLSARTLVAALAFSNGRYRVHGVPRMHERPIADLVEGLQPLGANIRYEANQGFPPLIVEPATPSARRATRVRGDVSSQFLTGLLQAAPLAAVEGDVTIDVEGDLISKPYIEITLNLMQRFGVTVEREGWKRFRIAAGSKYRSPGRLKVEGDASSASYFLAAGVIGGGPVRVEGVGKASIQGDVRFAEVLEQLGGTIVRGDDWMEASRPGGAVLNAVDFDANHIPDAAMTLAVAALFAEGTTTIRNIASWRVKETDRLAAMATELRKTGATVEEGPDFIRVTPPSHVSQPAPIDTYDDHRMAMCFSLASFGPRAIRINDPGCVAKTFPGYFAAFSKLVS